MIVGMIGRNMTVLANNNHADAAKSIMTKNLPTETNARLYTY